MRFHQENINRIKLSMLAAAVLCGTVMPQPAFAAEPGALHTAEEMAHLSDNKLEWSEIDGLISEYNATVVKNRNEWSNDQRRTSDAREVQDYLIDKADDYDSLADASSDTNAVVSAQYKSTANSLRLQAESSVSDSEVIDLEYSLVEKQTAESARTAFLNYYSSLYTKEFADANEAYCERAYASAVNKMNVGMATETDVLTAKETLDSAKADVLTAESNITSYRNALIVMCGWKYDSKDVVIGELPAMSAESIASVDYAADLAKARAANLTLKMDEKKLANAKSGSYTALVVEQNENQYKNDTESFGINFKSAYDTLVNAGTAYTNAVNDKAVADRSLQTADKQLELGSISSIEYEGTKNSAKSAWLAERKAYIAMLQAKAAYDAAVNGNV